MNSQLAFNQKVMEIGQGQPEPESNEFSIGIQMENKEIGEGQPQPESNQFSIGIQLESKGNQSGIA